jgi:hypothetical protein
MPINLNLDNNSWRRGWNPNANWKNQMMDRVSALLTRGDEQQLGAYGQIANQGLYDVPNLLRGFGTGDSSYLNNFRKRLSQRYSRRLGARRGGAVESAMGNIYGQLAGQYGQTRRGLLMANALSKFNALRARDDVLNRVLGEYQSTREQEEDGGGFLDIISAISDIASMIPGPWQVPAAGVSAGTKISGGRKEPGYNPNAG